MKTDEAARSLISLATRRQTMSYIKITNVKTNGIKEFSHADADFTQSGGTVIIKYNNNHSTFACNTKNYDISIDN